MLIPNHVAIIMDGSRRWARSRGLKEIEGHKKVSIVLKLVGYAAKTGVKSITFWAFSTENWTRDQRFLRYFWLFRHVPNDRKDFFDDLVKSGGQVHILEISVNSEGYR